MKQGWEIKKLGEVCTIQMGQSPSSDTYNDLAEGLPFFQGNADFGRIYPKVRVYCNAPIRIADMSDILISVRAPIGAINIANLQCCIGRGLAAIKNSSEVGQSFLYHALIANREKIISQGTGSTFKSIGKSVLNDLQIPVPPLSEQEKIVAELDCLSGIIEKKKQQLKEYDALAQSIFYEMFGDPVENEKGWDVERFGEVTRVVGGYAFKSGLFTEEGIPVLRIGNINTGYLKTDIIVFYQEDSSLTKYLVYPGDLVMSLTGTVGKDDYGNVCLLDNTYPKYYLNQRNAKFVLSEKIQVDYLKFFFKDTQIKSKLTGVNRGVRQGNISNKDIEGLVIPLPPFALQQKFASKIEAIEKQKELIKKSIKEVETLFNSRMDYYFN